MSLPADRRIVTGRTHSRTWYAEDYDPIQRYRGGGGPGWWLAQMAFVVLLFGGAAVGAFFYLAL